MEWGIKRYVVVFLGVVGMNVITIALLALFGAGPVGWRIYTVCVLVPAPIMFYLTER